MDFYDVTDDVKQRFMAIYDKKSFAINIDFKFLGSSKQKQLIKVSKLNDQYSYLLDGKNVLVVINEDLYDSFENDKNDNKVIDILFEQEIDKIDVNVNTGKIKMLKPDLNTFSGLVNKYGIEDVARANQVEDLALDQSMDKESEFIS